MGVAAGKWSASALGKIASELPLDQKDDYDHSPTLIAMFQMHLDQ